MTAFERERIPVNSRVMARGRDLGRYLQPVLTPAVHAAAERHHTPEAVMAEIAVLDF